MSLFVWECRNRAISKRQNTKSTRHTRSAHLRDPEEALCGQPPSLPKVSR